MIVRTYGKLIESVDPVFSAVALTNVAFRRNRAFSMPVEEFERIYERARGHEIGASADGAVQLDVETSVLETMEAELRRIVDELDDEELVLVENQRGVDEPKLREKRETQVVEGENRLYFHWWADPPLKVGVYRRRDEHAADEVG